MEKDKKHQKSAGEVPDTPGQTEENQSQVSQAENAEASAAGLQEVQKKLEEAQDALNKQKDLFLRTAAEYDNYRKRTEREKASVYSDATAAAVLEFLPVADNLTRALEQKDCSVEDLRKGVEMVCRQMESALAKLNVEEMGAQGDAFDPSLHNAVSHVDDESAAENSISQVFQKGYKIGDKVIRHAMVQVAN